MPTERTLQRVKERLVSRNCKFVAFDPNRTVHYVCSCGNKTKSHVSNILRKGWKWCCSCSNQRRGNFRSYEFAKKVWEEAGEHLPPQEYLGNKIKMFYTCSHCGKVAHISLNEFRRGRRCEHCSKDRAKITSVGKYGTSNPSKSEVIKQKIVNTCLERYGVPYVMQCPELVSKQEKASFTRKEYIFPSGRIDWLQGYEPRCVDLLLEKYTENDIITGAENIPSIIYTYPETVKHIYYPDLYIPSKNIIIEVKSDYTLGLDLEKNIAKFQTTASKGYFLHLYVFDAKKLLYIEVYHPDGFVVYHPQPEAVLIIEDK